MNSAKGYLILVVLLILPISAMALSANKIYKKASPSIYLLYGLTQDGDINAFGSGVAVTPHIIATNCHVALSGNSLWVKDRDEYHLGKIFYYDEDKDLCLVEIDATTLVPIASTRSIDLLEKGEQVIAIGNPAGNEKTITQGIISNILSNEHGQLIQFTAEITGGSSGGGLFDGDGRLIGITTRSHETLSFHEAIPIDWVTDVLRLNENNEINEDNQYDARNERDQLLTDLGAYGKDHIGLFKYHTSCFFHLYGRSKEGEIFNSMIWYPDYPNHIFLLPKSTTPLDAFAALKFEMKYYQSEKIRRTRNTIILNNKSYRLNRYKKSAKSGSLLFVQLKQEPTSLFLNGLYFVAELKKTGGGSVTVYYGLRGFRDALLNYEEYC